MDESLNTLQTAKPLGAEAMQAVLEHGDVEQGLAEAGLNNIQVQERFVFDTALIKAAFDDKGTGLSKLFQGLSEAERQGAIERLISQAAGKVWSAKFTAKKY